jgi:energy-coupling factor transporter ATP-binding protein EcfA2
MIRDGQSPNPYVGLRPFDHADSLYFFGRRAQVSDLLQRLHETRFLAVVGSSGCGKSSLIRAGLIPALLGGFLVQDRDRWLIARMKPGGGDGPIGNLALALCSMEGPEPKAEEVGDLAGAIVEDHVQAVVDHLKPRLGTDANLLLLLDQFEEIFAFRGKEQEESLAEMDRSERVAQAIRQREASDFVDLVLALAEQREVPVYVVLTMRSDFIGDCDLFYNLPEAMNLSRYLVPRLNRGQLREAIGGPALLMGQ